MGRHAEGDPEKAFTTEHMLRSESQSREPNSFSHHTSLIRATGKIKTTLCLKYFIFLFQNKRIPRSRRVKQLKPAKLQSRKGSRKGGVDLISKTWLLKANTGL